MPGIEPGAFHMQSERSTTEPHPQLLSYMFRITIDRNNLRHVHGIFISKRNASAAWNISCILTYDLIGNMLEITFSHIHLFYIEDQIFDGCVTDMDIFTIIIRQDKKTHTKKPPALPMCCPNVECKTFIYFIFHPQRKVLIIGLCIWQNVEQLLKSSHNRRSVKGVFLKRATPTYMVGIYGKCLKNRTLRNCFPPKIPRQTVQTHIREVCLSFLQAFWKCWPCYTLTFEILDMYHLYYVWRDLYLSPYLMFTKIECSGLGITTPP